LLLMIYTLIYWKQSHTKTFVSMSQKNVLIFIKFNLTTFILKQSSYHTIASVFISYMIGAQVGAVSHPLASMPPAVKISSAPQVGGQTPIQSSPSLSVPLALQRVAS